MQDTFELMTTNGAVHVPIVAAFGVDGRPVEVTGEIEPMACDHRGSTWSSDLALRCPRCGVPLFLPPRFLAHKHEFVVNILYEMWRAAGCPPWDGTEWGISRGRWPLNQALWRADISSYPVDVAMDWWTMHPVPEFEMLGGLPVQQSRLAAFVQRWPTAIAQAAPARLFRSPVKAMRAEGIPDLFTVAQEADNGGA